MQQTCYFCFIYGTEPFVPSDSYLAVFFNTPRLSKKYFSANLILIKLNLKIPLWDKNFKIKN